MAPVSRNKMTAISFVLLSLLSLGVKLTVQLKFNSVQIPSLVQRGTNFWLVCQYELTRGDDQLYGVKWYKDNEEFYRFQASLSNHDHPIGSQLESGTQQYFSLAGTNVLMNASNATHVRLLNASLASEGEYACEISTQNLSTIRYGKEIKVYVLPQSRLNISGFKSRYSLGDQVDLLCSSDFTRPKPALAWFINGRLISSKLGDKFELRSQTRDKLNEVSLKRVNLALKFKLTQELLASLLHNRPTDLSNQSRPKMTHQQQHSNNKLASSSYQLASANSKLELKIQCKYKLTEISDVTFNELLVSRKQLSTSSPHETEVDLDSDAGSTSGGRRGRKLRVKSLARQANLAGGKLLRLAKNSNGQVIQSKSPAAADELRQILLPAEMGADSGGQCQLGSLALQFEDPLILSTHSRQPESGLDRSNNNNQNEVMSSWDLHLELERPSTTMSQANKRHIETIARDNGDRLSVNCTTIGAILGSLQPQEPEVDGGLEAGGLLCADLAARRRSLISGKYSSNEDHPHLVAKTNASSSITHRLIASNQQLQHHHQQQQQQQQQIKHQLAYLSLGQQKWLQLQELSPDADSSSFKRPLQQQQQQQLSQTTIMSPPPLLEWFINNQEAPKSSVRYSPELPTSVQESHSSESEGALIPGRGSSDGATSVPLWPSIDYTEYFANFNNKPTEQHLALELKLNKQHFMTSDSNLQLRCSSTQAQLLDSDSATVIIVALNENELATGWNQRPQMNQNNKHMRKSNRLAQPAIAGSTSARSSAHLMWPSSHWLPVILISTVIIL